MNLLIPKTGTYYVAKHTKSWT